MNELVSISVNDIYSHPDNPRKDVGDVTELAESIKKKGVMQNLTVIPGHYVDGELVSGGYTLIIGHRRCAAAKLAGVEWLPCRIVKDMSYKEQFATMLEENMQRTDLTIYEQAQGFQMMLNLGDTEDTIAEKTGFSKTTIRHRLNIAKLDASTLKEKESEEEFQLNLTDLYSLEKVSDIKTRNKILSEARNSRDLKAKALDAVREERRKQNKKALHKMLKDCGCKKAPNGAESERYDGKWDILKEFRLDDDVPMNAGIEMKPDTYYVDYYYSVGVIRRKVKEKVKLSPQQIKQKEKDKNLKSLKALYKDMVKYREDFIMDIVTGKVEPIKDELVMIERIWSVIMKTNAFPSLSTLRTFFGVDNYYSLPDDEKEKVVSKINALTTINSMLIVMHSGNREAPVDWMGKYNKEKAESLIAIYDIFVEYGFSHRSEEDAAVINGTHNLYNKED